MMATMRTAGAAHAPVLAALHDGAFAESWNATAFAELLKSPGAAAIIADTDAGPRGFVLWRVAADEAEIVTIAVTGDARRQGLGRLLLDVAEAAAFDAGARRLILEVADDNSAALALYRGGGYRDIGRREKYYRRDEGWADAILMARALTDSAKEAP